MDRVFFLNSSLNENLEIDFRKETVGDVLINIPLCLTGKNGTG